MSVPSRRPRLIALDADDLAVISTHVQDAEIRVADIHWLRDENRLVIGLKRLDWDQALSGQVLSDQALNGEISPQRLVAALRFDRVLACQSRNIDRLQADATLYLLGIEFHDGVAPGGSAVLMFSNGSALRLDVECLECELADLGTNEAAPD